MAARPPTPSGLVGVEARFEDGRSSRPRRFELRRDTLDADERSNCRPVRAAPAADRPAGGVVLRASPTSAAATRASRSRAATSTRSSTTPTGPSSSSRTPGAAARSARASRSAIRSDSKLERPRARDRARARRRRLAIVGYTIGNDVSSRDIEGANPLYLPQAKVYAGACAIGPAVYVPDDWDAPLAIELTIRDGDGDASSSRADLDRDDARSFRRSRRAGWSATTPCPRVACS